MASHLHLHFIFFIWSMTLLMIFPNARGDEIEVDHRDKRQLNSLPLVYPYGGTYKLLIGFSLPVHNNDNVSLAFAVNFQYQYLQFQNITQLSQYFPINTVSREQRDADLQLRKDERLIFYKAVADLLDSRGINGHHCVMQAICQAAQYPVGEEALVGEVLHILLTPDYGRTAFDEEDPEWMDYMAVYIDAAKAGRQMFDCSSIYSACPEGQGLLDLITLLRDE